MSRRWKTGYYDRTGKAIKDGDRIKAIIGGQIHKGYVEERDGIWFLCKPHIRISLGCLKDVEILEEVT